MGNGSREVEHAWYNFKHNSTRTIASNDTICNLKSVHTSKGDVKGA